MQTKKPEAAFAVPTPLPCPDLLYLKKQAAFCVPCEQYASRREIILRRHTANCNSFFERWQERTNFSAKSKSPTLFRKESVGLLHSIGEYRLCEVTRDACCRASRPCFDFILLIITKISTLFGKDGKNGRKNSNFGHLFRKSRMYNSYFAVRFIKICEIHYK